MKCQLCGKQHRDGSIITRTGMTRSCARRWDRMTHAQKKEALQKAIEKGWV